MPIFESDKMGEKGILYRPEQSRGRAKQGVVKYVGKEVTTIQIGDYVFFSGYAGTVFRLEGEGTLLFMPEENILAVLNNRTTDIDGLFFYGGEGKYFKATFEQAMILINRAMEKFYLEVKDPQDRVRGSKRTKTGQLFLIKTQEHMMGEDCFCMENAKEYNQGICKKCGGLIHFASNKLWDKNFYHCENMSCQFNTLNKIS